MFIMCCQWSSISSSMFVMIVKFLGLTTKLLFVTYIYPGPSRRGPLLELYYEYDCRYWAYFFYITMNRTGQNLLCAKQIWWYLPTVLINSIWLFRQSCIALTQAHLATQWYHSVIYIPALWECCTTDRPCLDVTEVLYIIVDIDNAWAVMRSRCNKIPFLIR